MGLFTKKEKQDIEAEVDAPFVPSYNNAWLRRVCDNFGFKINVDQRTVGRILGVINRSKGFCTCKESADDDNKCPCSDMRMHGECECSLFQEIPKVNKVGSISTATIKRNDIY